MPYGIIEPSLQISETKQDQYIDGILTLQKKAVATVPCFSHDIPKKYFKDVVKLGGFFFYNSCSFPSASMLPETL